MKTTRFFMTLAVGAALLLAGCSNNGALPVKVMGITLNETAKTLAPGETFQLTASILPENATDKSVKWTTSNASAAAVGETTGLVSVPAAAADGATATITATANDGSGKTATLSVIVRDGVWINGVTWAPRNVGADKTFTASPESTGAFFQWNRSKAWPATGTVTGWDATTPTGDSWEAANDPCPTGWRVPTKAEQDKLFETGVTNEWVTSPTNGHKFTETATGKSIFFPAAGFRNYGDGTLVTVGYSGYCWSSTMGSADTAWGLTFNSGGAGQNGSLRTYGNTVRCVLQ